MNKLYKVKIENWEENYYVVGESCTEVEEKINSYIEEEHDTYNLTIIEMTLINETVIV